MLKYFIGILLIIVAIVLYINSSPETVNELTPISTDANQDINKSQTPKKDLHLTSKKSGEKNSPQNSLDNPNPSELHEVDSSVLNEDGSSKEASDDSGSEMSNVEEVDTAHEEMDE